MISARAMVMAMRDDVSFERRMRYVFDEGHHLFDAADAASPRTSPAPRWRTCAAGCADRKGAPSRAQRLAERMRGLMPKTRTDKPRSTKRSPRRAHSRAKAGFAHQQRRRARAGRTFPRACLSSCARQKRRRRRALLAGGRASTMWRSICWRLRARSTHGLRRLGAPLLRLAPIICASGSTDETGNWNFQRVRLEAAARGMERRAKSYSSGLASDARRAGDEPAKSANLSTGSRSSATTGRDLDVGLERHWIDPTIPFAEPCWNRAWRADHLRHARAMSGSRQR